MKILQKFARLKGTIAVFSILILLTCMSVSSYNKQYEHTNDFLNHQSGFYVLECKIVSYPVYKNERYSFFATITKSNEKFLHGKKIYITAKNDNLKFYNGDTIRFQSELSSPQSAGNEGEFDYKTYLKGENAVGVCSMKDYVPTKISSDDTVLGDIYRIRDKFTTNCDKYLPDYGAGLLKAVVGGDRSGIDVKSENAFKESGIYHIVAVSGLHLNLFIFAVFNLIAKIKMKRLKKAIVSFAAGIIIGLFILVFTGFSISVIRAFLMITILSASSLMSREYNSKNSLLLSAIIIIITIPYSVYNVAFWLSCQSTLGVIVGSDVIKYLKENPKFKLLAGTYIGNTFVISLSTTIFTLPITTIVFGYVPIYAWITNALVLPVMPYFLGLGAVFVASSALLPSLCTELLGYALTSLAAYILYIARLVQNLPYATIDTYIKDVAIMFVLMGVTIIYGYYIFKGYIKKAVVTILLFIVAGSGFLLYNYICDDQTIKITYADVGQGACAIVQCNETTVMIDCGTNYDDGYSLESIEAYLRRNNIHQIDLAIVSHYHVDHMNIMCSLIEDSRVKALMMPRYYDSTEKEAKQNRSELLKAAGASHTKVIYANKGTTASFGEDAIITMISPSADMFLENNDMSLVFNLAYGETDFLFCGDISDEYVKYKISNQVKCDVLLIPHHGGYSEGIEDFIEKTNAELAIVSCGRNNVYGHPDERIIKYCKSKNIKLRRTDLEGAITVIADKKGNYKISTMR